MGSKFRESSCGKLHMRKSHVHHWSKLDSSCSSYMSVEGNLVVLLYTVEVCVIVLAMDHCPLSSIHVIK
jgi:hypothetical protein